MSGPYESAAIPSPSMQNDDQGGSLRSHVEADLVKSLGHAPMDSTPGPMDVDQQQQPLPSPEEEARRMDVFNKRFRRPQTTDPRDFHYVSPARWNQLRRDLEHCERTGKSPKTTLNNIAKVVDAGTMAETDEGCPAETPCSECSKRAGVTCFAWRDSSKGRSCAYCKKQGISKCDAKQAEMRSEMERRVDTIAETVDLMLGELRALSRQLRGEATEEDQTRPALPQSVTHLRPRVICDIDDDADMDTAFDPSQYSINGHDHHNGNSNINPALDSSGANIHPQLNGDASLLLPDGITAPSVGRGKKRPRSSLQGANPEGGKRRAGTRNGGPSDAGADGSSTGNSSDAAAGNSRRRAGSTTSSSNNTAAQAVAAAAAAAAAAEGDEAIDPAVQAANSITGFRPL